MQSTSCEMPGWMKHKLESRLLGEISRKWKKGVKNWLRAQNSENKDHGIWSHHFMSDRWGNNGNSEKLYFLGLQNHCVGDCSHESKRCLLLERKGMANLDIILKNKDITLLTKVPVVKAMIFPVVMYRYESWTIKKAECWRISGFELWCWRRLLRVPWTTRRSNQVIVKEIILEYTLKGLMLKLKIWPPDMKIQHIGKDPDAEKYWKQKE